MDACTHELMQSTVRTEYDRRKAMCLATEIIPAEEDKGHGKQIEDAMEDAKREGEEVAILHSVWERCIFGEEQEVQRGLITKAMKVKWENEESEVSRGRQ